METRVTEIADGIHQLSTFIADVGPTGMRFNQYLIDDEQPLLFHTGHRALFPLVSAAIGSIMPIERLRCITFGHVEADECGAMNEFLAAAPAAEVAHGLLGCMVSLNDLAERPPVPLTDGQVLDLGRHRVRHIDTPHVPHGWEARLIFDETTGTLFCGDLMTQLGEADPLVDNDVLAAAAVAEDMFGATCLTPATAPTIRRLADLGATTLATMHGSAFNGDASAALNALADSYDERLLVAG